MKENKYVLEEIKIFLKDSINYNTPRRIFGSKIFEMESIKATVDIEMGTPKDINKMDHFGGNRIKSTTNETKDQFIIGLTEIVIEENNQIEKCPNENKANIVDTTMEINQGDSKTNGVTTIKKETVIWRNKCEPLYTEKQEEIIVSVPLCDINTVFTDVKIRNTKDINQTLENPIVVVNEITNGTNENSIHVYNNLNQIETDPNNPTGNNENDNNREPQDENNNLTNQNGNDTVELNRNGSNSNENLDEVMDNLRTYILEDDINVSNRMNRNLYYCDLFIHGSYLLTVLVLCIALAVDFSKESVSRNETYMKIQCAVLLLVLLTHICMKIHDVRRMLKRLETPRAFKIFESYFHGFAMILSLFCLYIYVFQSNTYPVNATFATAIIVALVYYFTSVVLFIILRIFLLIFILVILIVRRKTPTPKRILRKLKIMTYSEFKIFCEEGKFLKDNYFYIEEKEEEKEEKEEKEKDGKHTKETEHEKEENEGENKGESEYPEKENNKQHRINTDEEGMGEKEESNRGNVDKWSNSTSLQPRFLSKRKGTTKREIENQGKLKKEEKEEEEKLESDLKRKEKRIDIKTETEDNNFQDMKKEAIESNGNKIYQTNQRDNSEHTNNYNRSTIAENEEKNEVVEMTGIMHFIKTLLKRKHMKKETDVKFLDKIEESYVHIDIENINLACSVCCIEYLDDDEVCVLPCNYLHFFHKKCIFTWLKKNNECPFCRKNVESLFKRKRRWGKKNRTMSK